MVRTHGDSIVTMMEQEGRALPRPALRFTIDSPDVSAERVYPSLLTFPKLRANNTSVGIVGQISKNAKAFERREKKKDAIFVSVQELPFSFVSR